MQSPPAAGQFTDGQGQQIAAAAAAAHRWPSSPQVRRETHPPPNSQDQEDGEDDGLCEELSEGGPRARVAGYPGGDCR
jgi:hypothetical protein